MLNFELYYWYILKIQCRQKSQVSRLFHRHGHADLNSWTIHLVEDGPLALSFHTADEFKNRWLFDVFYKEP